MITAVDANVFFDVLAGSGEEKLRARTALAVGLRQGALVVSVIVYAELSGRFGYQSELNRFIESWRCAVEPLDAATAHLAGLHFKGYRERGGERTRILPDFLIAAHAELNADRLVTRDNRFFGESFPKLIAVTPEEMASRSS